MTALVVSAYIAGLIIGGGIGLMIATPKPTRRAP